MNRPETRMQAAGRAWRSSRARAGVVVAVTGLLAAACGSTSHEAVLKTAPVERAIVQTIQTQHGINADVVCPNNTVRKRGQHFKCVAKLAVGAYDISVVETNARGAVRFSNSAPLRVLDSHTVERAIEHAILEQRHMTSTVVCPNPILQRAGVRFSCTATTKKGRGPFVVTEVGDSGHVKFIGR